MIEVMTFRLSDGVKADEFQAVDAHLQTEFFYSQPGLIRRTSGRNDDGLNVVVTHWDSDDEAEEAARLLEAAPHWVGARALIDQSTLVIQRFSTS